MLTKEDNELITRTGPGTPMGNLLRQYWIPAVKSDELAAPDSPPVRIRLLGEDLIAFRVTSSGVGIVQNACPHRGASLFFGRNEEDGLRCVYHGWKFDVTGACVDMPSEPVLPGKDNFKTKVRAKAYPTAERNGLVFAYMGPREVPPPLPDLEPNMVPADGRFRVQANMIPWNWVQAIENRMDTAHVAFLHYGSITEDLARDPEWSLQNGDADRIIQYMVADRSPAFTVRDTEFGCSYAAFRGADDDTDYYRTAHFLFPFITMGPGTTKLGTGCRLVAVVPIDDEHTMEWSLSNVVGTGGAGAGGGGRGSALLPNATDWLGRFRSALGGDTDYDIDREVQKSEKSERGFTGLQSVYVQDRAISWSQGPLFDRSGEHLGTTDAMVIRVRRRLLAAARALAEHGTTPPGVDEPHVYRQRSGWVILPKGVDYWEATREMREAFALEAPVETRVS